VYDSILAAHIDRRENASMAISASAQQHLFTALRKAANHPLLLRTRHTSEEAVNHLAEKLFQFGYFGRHETCTERHVRQELESFSDFDVHCAALELLDENPLRRDELARYTLAEEDLFTSPKFVRLRTLLPELVEKGHRVLIFSQWTRCLDLLGCLMECLKMECLRLDGGTAISERQMLIDKFNKDCSIPVFLLSTRAGGMGK
jgi:SWI/SNF-related matrix-associated actin-dependent regulator 1 of chromatin subfamily A